MTVYADTPEYMEPLPRKLPDCPKCGHDELWVQQFNDGWRLRCYLCSLDSGIQHKPEGMTLSDHVEQMVGVYREFYAKMGWALGNSGKA